MLNSQWQTVLREIEHVENDGLLASVLTVVNGVYHLYNGLTLVNHLLLAVLTDDGQFALYQHTIVHHGMVVPTQFLTGGEHLLHSH